MIYSRYVGRFAFGLIYAYTIVFLAKYINSPEYPGRAFAVEPIHPVAFLFLLILAAIPAVWALHPPSRPSYMLYQFLYLMAFVPGMVLPAHYYGDAVHVLPINLALFAGFFTFYLVYRFPLIVVTGSPSQDVNLRVVFWIGIIFTSMLLIFIAESTAGFSLRALHFSDPHDAREIYHAVIGSQSAFKARITRYSFNWLKNVIFPLFIAVGLWYRKLLYTGFGVVGLGLIYTTGGHRDALFAIVVVVALTILLQDPIERFPAYISSGLLGTIWAAIAANHFFGAYMLVSLLRRLLISQGMHVGTYYDYFVRLENPFVYLSDRPFVPWISYPYDRPVPNMIGLHQYPHGEFHANANLWADGYAMFGLVGVIIFSLLLAGVFYTFDSLAYNIDIRLSMVLLGGQIITVLNTAFVNTMFTHGFLLLLFITALLSVAMTQNDQMESDGDLGRRAQKGD